MLDLLVVAILSALVAWIAAAYLLERRVRAMLAMTDRLAAGDLGARTGLPSNGGEMGRLAQALDRMAERLQEREAKVLETEERLRHAQKMEAVGRLAAGVAHDFNNLLTVINGVSDLALRRLLPGSPMHVELGQIRDAGERAAELTRQLLTIGRRQPSQVRILKLAESLSGCEAMLRRVIGEDVSLVVRHAPDVSPVRADPGQIEQVVMNLAVNARDAMPRGGRLSIETSETTLDETYARVVGDLAPGRYAVISVSDTGQGMDLETQARCFEPFFTTKGEGKGTGLGLSTVYGIAKQHGGHVWLYSEAGKGTTFKVYLPVVAGAAPPAVAPPAAAATKGTETILVAEDDDVVRDLLRAFLDDLGYRVLAARSAEEAVEMCRAQVGPIHVLVTDMVMPGASGTTLAREIADARPGIAVLLMSGYPEEIVMNEEAPPPGSAFLQKPFTQEALSRKVRELLSRGA
ncbi:MAG: ATP-binding protein [Planctomycetota bacterium]